MSRAGELWRRLGLGWWGLLLLCLARGLAAGDFPPLVAEGEVIDDPEGVIAGIMPRAEVNAVAFSADGRLLASASGSIVSGSDNTVRLWDPATGTAVRTLEGHGDGVLAVAFSPDGRLLASAWSDGKVRLWDPASGAAVRTLEGHGAWVSAVAFSPDGRVLASASWDKTVRLWDPATGAAVRALEGHGDGVNAVAFSPDGRLLASASGDETVRLWDPATGAAVRTLEGHGSWVGAVAFSSDGRLLASGSGDGTVRLWDPKSGVCKLILVGGHGGAWVACRLAEGRCWRHDDGSLLVRQGPNGLLIPVPPPAGAEPARLKIYALGTPDAALATGDGRSAEVTVRIVNHGSAPSYWLAIHQARAFGDPVLYTPPPVHPRLDPGQSVDLTGRVSYQAAWTDPKPHTGLLKLRAEHAHGDAAVIEISVEAVAPELRLIREPRVTAGFVTPGLQRPVQSCGQGAHSAPYQRPHGIRAPARAAAPAPGRRRRRRAGS